MIAKKLAICVAVLVVTLLAAPRSYASLVFPGDAIEFDGSRSGNSAIGASCVSGPTTACVVATGDVQDVTGTIASLLPFGICCGSSDISVSINDAVEDDVFVNDDFYGSFTGSVPSTATGNDAKLFWASAVSGEPFTLYFTDDGNTITDVIFGTGAPVPEPASMLVLATGLVGIGLSRRRKAA